MTATAAARATPAKTRDTWIGPADLNNQTAQAGVQAASSQSSQLAKRGSGAVKNQNARPAPMGANGRSQRSVLSVRPRERRRTAPSPSAPAALDSNGR